MQISFLILKKFWNDNFEIENYIIYFSKTLPNLMFSYSSNLYYVYTHTVFKAIHAQRPCELNMQSQDWNDIFHVRMYALEKNKYHDTIGRNKKIKKQ